MEPRSLAVTLAALAAACGAPGADPSNLVEQVGELGAGFSVSPGQVLSRGRIVAVRIPGATDAAMFLDRAGAAPILIGLNRGLAPQIAYGPDCEEPPCTVADSFQFRLGKRLRKVPDGPATLRVVSPIGSGRVVGSRAIYWAGVSPRARFRQPAFGASVRPAGIKVVARTDNDNVTSIEVTAVRPWGHCPPLPTPNVPPFEQHWLGNDLGPHKHSSCAPTSVAAALQYLHANDLADVVPDYPDCALAADCQDPSNLVASRCLVTDLGYFLDTNHVRTGGAEYWGTPTPLEDGIEGFLSSHFGYVAGTDYEINDEYSGFPVRFTPARLALEYASGGPFVVGGNNQFDSVPEDEVFGHFVAIDGVTTNADGTAEVTIMEVHTAVDDSAPACGNYVTSHVATDGTFQYLSQPDGLYYPFGWTELVTMHGFDHPDPGCGPRFPVPVEKFDPHIWEGIFTAPAPGAWLLVSETVHADGFTSRAFQLVNAR